MSVFFEKAMGVEIVRDSNGRFKKEHSGNPRGRPRKPKPRGLLPRQEDLQAILEYEMLKEHPYSVNGEEASRPYIVLFIQKLKIDALKGDKTARKMILTWWKEHLAAKYEDKMKLFEAIRDEMLFEDMLKMNEKI